MIKQVIRLIRPGLFLPCFAVETPQDDDILIRPRFLSICAADQRYFQGNRPPEVLAQKLPLALFHEAVGEVLHDPSGEFKPGAFCVLLPGGTESEEDDSNYKRGAFFRGYDKIIVTMYPKELSGGMKQGVAIARACSAHPEVLLLNEPFSALDAQTRIKLQSGLLDAWEQEKNYKEVAKLVNLSHENCFHLG